MPAFSYQGMAAAVNCSGVMRRMYSAFIQRSFSTSKIAGDLESPSSEKASISSGSVKNSRLLPGFQPIRAM